MQTVCLRYDRLFYVEVELSVNVLTWLGPKPSQLISCSPGTALQINKRGSFDALIKSLEGKL